MTIQQDIVKPALPALIKLFEIDATIITGSIYRFTPSVNNGASLVWGGQTWSPFPISISGIEHNSDGAPPRPRLTVSNLDGFFMFLSSQFDDAVGALLTYREIFSNYLGTSISCPPLYYSIAKPLPDSRLGKTYELKSPLEVDKKWVPARQMLRDGALPFPGLAINKQTR